MESPEWKKNNKRVTHRPIAFSTFPRLHPLVTMAAAFFGLETAHLLTYWSLLVGKKRGMVAAVHVRHTYVIAVSPVQLPEEADEGY